jgi:hypothetical protein
MQSSNIQHQHFWIEISIGALMLINVINSPLEKGIIATIVLGMTIIISQNIRKSRIAALKRAEQRRARAEEQARREEERRQKQEAFRQAQLEAAKKYLD